jgi:hypothetical protein
MLHAVLKLDVAVILLIQRDLGLLTSQLSVVLVIRGFQLSMEE